MGSIHTRGSRRFSTTGRGHIIQNNGSEHSPPSGACQPQGRERPPSSGDCREGRTAHRSMLTSEGAHPGPHQVTDAQSGVGMGECRLGEVLTTSYSAPIPHPPMRKDGTVESNRYPRRDQYTSVGSLSTLGNTSGVTTGQRSTLLLGPCRPMCQTKHCGRPRIDSYPGACSSPYARPGGPPGQHFQPPSTILAVVPLPPMTIPMPNPTMFAPPLMFVPVSATIYTIPPPIGFQASSAPPLAQATEPLPFPTLQLHIGLPNQVPPPINITFLNRAR
ncbi:hypothetical protein CRG98_011732 [Punica granatum]|uniref:Uncharacterized protein n=1 Tax=Punica granatum TaxID=22663 RepID=A0A2I0KHA8_PUNGR|nr:hypothetical protein CRG98_011732 [Punica granatum]